MCQCSPFGIAPKIASHALLARRTTKFHNKQRTSEGIGKKKFNRYIIQTCQPPSFCLSLSLLLFLCVFSCLFLLPSVPWSACQGCRRLCSSSKSFHSDSQWNFVSVSQLKRSKSQSSVRHSSSLCLLIIARLWGIPRSSCLFRSNSLWNIWCVPSSTNIFYLAFNRNSHPDHIYSDQIISCLIVWALNS